MPKQKKQTVVLDVSRDKKMILALDPAKHSWVKSIADATGMAQPKVVNLIIAEASKVHADDYIAQINKLNAKDKLAEIEEKAKQLESERKRLKDLLDS